MSKHEFNSIWKVNGGYSLQADNGIMFFKRLRDAKAMQAAVTRRDTPSGAYGR